MPSNKSDERLPRMTVWLLYGPPAAADVACTMTELFGHVSTEPQRLSEAKRW